MGPGQEGYGSSAGDKEASHCPGEGNTEDLAGTSSHQKCPCALTHQLPGPHNREAGGHGVWEGGCPPAQGSGYS